MRIKELIEQRAAERAAKRAAQKTIVGNPPAMQSRRQPKPTYSSQIGDIITRRFEALGIKSIAGCPCKNLHNELNSMTPEAVMSNITGFSVKLRNSAKKWKELKGGVWNYIPAPPLWLCRRVLEDAIKEAKGIVAAEQLTSVAEPGK